MRSLLARFRADAHPSDRLFLGYCLALSAVILIFAPDFAIFAAAHLALAAVVVLTGARRSAGMWRDWDALVYIPAIFWMTTVLVHAVHPVDRDALLIGWDRALGGDALLRWTQSWSTPATDEIGKLFWVSYYFLPILPVLVLHRRGARAAFHEAKLVFVTAWLVSYALYFAVPAQGPLHHKTELGLAEPSDGVALAGTLKQVVGTLEGEGARNAFPSGHAMIAALVIFVCLRNRLWRLSALAVPLALGVILSTLSLRYHYLVDVAAGLLLCGPIAAGSLYWHARAGPERG